MKHLKFTLLILSILLMSVGCKKQIDKVVFTKIVNEVNKQCPMEVDYLTTLENCEYVPDKKIKYNYIIDTDMMNQNLDLFRQSIEKQITYEMSIMMSQKETQALKKLHPTIIFSYKDKAGKFIFEKEMTPEMYATPQQIKMNKDELFEHLKQNAEMLTGKNQEIEEGIFLTAVNAIYPDILAFDYSMPYVDVTDIDTFSFKEILIPAISDEMRINNEDQMMKDQNVIFRYTYYGEDNAYLCTIDITPDMYK